MDSESFIESLGHQVLSYVQPCSFNTLVLDAGLLINFSAGLIGLITKFPEQFGQLKFNTVSAQLIQNVHSKVQIIASFESAVKSLSQHSQFGLSSNILFMP